MAASALASVGDLYRHVWSFRDTRIDGWGLVTEGRFILPLLVAYVYAAKIAGPRWMKDRKPFELRGAILAYNVAAAAVNAYFFYRYARLTYFGGGYSFLCQGISKGTDEQSMAILTLSYWYLYVRIADFLETFFFVARKKYSQVSALHVIHHFLVVFSGWTWLNFSNDGQILLGLLINQAVHVIMYTYYFLAALGPAASPYLWWKKYLTTVQIVQFIFVLGHITIPIFYDCGYPKVLSFLAIAQLLLGLALFINFYVQTYSRRRNARKNLESTGTGDKIKLR